MAIGISYLRVIAPFYVLIGFLFMFYGLYRGLGRMNMSIILTIIFLGIRVILAYLLAGIPHIGLLGIWWAVTNRLGSSRFNRIWYIFKKILRISISNLNKLRVC